MLFTMQNFLALILFLTCCGAINGSTMDSIVLFGDSLSDNGNGYAGNAKFVLRTNQVMALANTCTLHFTLTSNVQPSTLAEGGVVT